MKILLPFLSLSLFFLPLPAEGSLSTFTTSQSPFDVGVNNQGWWSPTAVNSDSNDNYLTGISNGIQYRNFFTFDLSSLTLGETATSATLVIIRGPGIALNDPLETLEIFDVSTNAATLNNNVGTSQAIFDDLGTGTSYGSFAVAGSGGNAEELMFELNAHALADINAANGFFSIGGSLTSNDNTGNSSLFGSTMSYPGAKLIITSRP